MLDEKEGTMREITVVENVLRSLAGSSVKAGEGFSVRKTARGQIEAVFENEPGEPRTVKFTLTGMKPYTSFEVLLRCGEKERRETRRANRAGIFEIQTDMPESSRLFIQEKEEKG